MTWNDIEPSLWRYLCFALFAHQVMFKDSLLRLALSEQGKGVSSKRIIALSCTWAIIYLSITQKSIDTNILSALGIIDVLSSGMATLPQVLSLVQSIRSVTPPTPPTTVKTNTSITQTTTEKPVE